MTDSADPDAADDDQAQIDEEEVLARVEMILNEGDRREEFLVELERRMICGYSYGSRRRWAKQEYDISAETVDKIEALLRHGWRLQDIDPNSAFVRKDTQRQRYLYVFQQCVEAEDWRHALKALDSLSKIDGHMTAIEVTNNNLQVNVGATVTSQTRERITSLITRMRELAISNKQLVEKGRIPDATKTTTMDLAPIDVKEAKAK